MRCFNPRSLSRANDPIKRDCAAASVGFNPRSLSRANDTASNRFVRNVQRFNPRSLSRANDQEYANPRHPHDVSIRVRSRERTMLVDCLTVRCTTSFNPRSLSRANDDTDLLKRQQEHWFQSAFALASERWYELFSGTCSRSVSIRVRSRERTIHVYRIYKCRNVCFNPRSLSRANDGDVYQ